MTDIVDMDANVSSRINLMRIVLISGIIFVHVPFDPLTSPFLGAYGIVDWLRVYLGDSLFRIGVPCLSAISGYLLFRRGLDAFDYGKTLRTKALTILTPFLLWNGAFLAVVFVAQSNDIGFGYLPDVVNATPRELASLALALEAWPINIPLYFLRDLFLCLLLSPVIALLVAKYPRTTLVLMLAYAVLSLPNGIFLKKSILFGFSLGICVGLHGLNVKRLDRYAPLIVLAVLSASVLLSIGLYFTGPEFPAWLSMLRSLTAIAGIFGAWALSALLIRTRVGLALSRTAGLSFWIFCAHYPLLIAFWIVWNRLGSADYLVFYFASPVLALVILALTQRLVRHRMPGLHAVLTGSRAAPARAPRVRRADRLPNPDYLPQQR